MNRYILSFVLLCVFIFDGNRKAFAQKDTTDKSISHNLSIMRPAAEVRAVSYYAPGLNFASIDSVTLAHNRSGTITDLMSANGVYLRNYGNGALATLSIHGASSSQTAVMWNGVDLRSTTNGFADLSLLPVFLFDNIAVSTGASVNAIGGAIELRSYNGQSMGFTERVVNQIGSFGEMKNGAEVSLKKERTSFGIKGFQQHIDNNFTFTNIAQPYAPVDTLEHADYNSRGVMTDVTWLSKYRVEEHNSHMLRFYTWYNWSERKIAPTMFESGSEASQQDEFFRAILQYNGWYKYFDLDASSAFLTEFMDFEVGYGQPSSYTHSRTIENKVKLNRRFGKLYTVVGATQKLTTADVTGYLPGRDQMRNEFAAEVRRFFMNRLFVGVVVRDEILGNKFQPVTASLGATYKKNDLLTLRISLARNYRLPTFNDLYWTPGGNPDLKPEDSRNLDGGADLNLERGQWKFSYSISGYYRYTYNWIQWQPGPGYWEPKNLYEVKSYGVDHAAMISFHPGKWNFQLNGALTYVRAVNVKSAIPGDLSIDKQLMYLPAYISMGKLSLHYATWYGEWQTNYTGIRFVTTDHSSYLPDYTLYNVTAGKRTNLKSAYIDMFIRCENITDVDYQNIAWRPMPGRSIHLGISMQFNQPIKPKTDQ